MTRYWVLVADELIETMDPCLLPDGLRMTGGLQFPGLDGDGHLLPGIAWVQFEDDGAPEDLEGKRVDLILARQGREGAKAVIAERRVLP